MPTAKQKKKFRRFILILVLIALLGVAGWRGWQWWQLREARYTHYPAFGISIPGGYSIHGIDVSKYQHLIAWDGVKKMKVKEI